MENQDSSTTSFLSMDICGITEVTILLALNSIIAFPQTWESPSHLYPQTGKLGDDDPLDVLEIGSQIGYRGQIKQVKVLGNKIERQSDHQVF